MHSQVTIGSGIAPNPGSLLDLKQKNNTAGDVTSNAGFGLPRVKLLNLTLDAIYTNLAQTIDGNPVGTDWDADAHTGLVVFNVSETKPFCKGVYVWDGKTWERLQGPCMGITATPGTLYFPSGLNGSTITAAGVDIEWFPTTGTVNWASTGPISMSASPTSPWTAMSQNNVEFTPAAMTATEISTNAFATKAGEITLTVTDGSKTKDTKITVNQTNKAITIDGSLAPAIIQNPTAGSKSATILSNARWQLAEIVPENQSAFDNVSIAIKAVQGAEKNDGTADAPVTLTYDIRTGTNISRYSSLVFSDAAPIKRFSDVTLTIQQCSNTGGINPTMSQWAAMAGFTGVPETQSLSDADEVSLLRRDTPNPTTGIAWHRDQDGNIFLSASFDPNDPTGDSERWMITNLAAKTYASGVTHSAGRTPPATGNYNSTYSNTAWAYPNVAPSSKGQGNNATLYSSNPRLGLLYTWDAATAGKGGISGQGNVDNPTVLQESGFRELQEPRRQGICPNGWHLPSDDEWSVLERRIVENKSAFSNLPVSEGSATIPGTALYKELNNTVAPIGVSRPDPGEMVDSGYRGLASDANGHGNAMKEACEAGTRVYQGASNPISTALRGGFDALLAGYAYDGKALDYGSNGYFWSASSDKGNTAWSRSVISNNSQVYRNAYRRNYEFSVRCKK